MIDYTFKFPDEATAVSLLQGIVNVDIIGTIIQNDIPQQGWHVNVRSPVELPELVQYLVTPLTPIRVWF